MRKLYLIYPQSVIGLNIKELGILQCLYRCMLLPPVHDAICKKIKNPVYYTLVIVIIIVGISSLHFECPNVGLAQFIENVRHVLVHLPAFFIGFMLAPMAKEEKCISFCG